MVCQVLTPELSSRILREAQAQLAEVDAEADLLAVGGAVDTSLSRQVSQPVSIHDCLWSRFIGALGAVGVISAC